MTTSSLETALANLTQIQRDAVNWDEGALLVLAGPGSGKTQILTVRIARLLNESPKGHSRVLALTFTNKAADEMKSRVADFVPGLEERATVATFHSFCTQVLRQHGAHIGIKPDFAIYSIDEERKAILRDALDRDVAGDWDPASDQRYLALIDRLKSNLVQPSSAVEALGLLPERERVAEAYRLYEDELRRLNALDFNSLIFEVHHLVTLYPAVAARYRRSHPYWMLDEFQDTNPAQYRLLRALAGSEFRNVFAVADDDQIIYEWNGASIRQIQAFNREFAANLLQLPTNFRCPPVIVEAANRLVGFNARRTPDKEPLQAGRTGLRFPPEDHLQLRHYPSEEAEATGIAQEIAKLGPSDWGTAAVLARTRKLLERMQAALQEEGVPAAIAGRRDTFLSPEFRWLVAGVQQIIRPLDQRNAALLTESFNRMAGTEILPAQVITDAAATGRGYLATWAAVAMQEDLTPDDRMVVAAFIAPADAAVSGRQAIDACLEVFSSRWEAQPENTDLAEDLSAWREIWREIANQIGREAPLEQYLQELNLRSKEPTPKPGTVTLATIHGAKGRQFDFVYLIGLAEDVLPSFQSKQKGDDSVQMEEERRNCFVAITRTRECLVLSRADRYRGWPKKPSRFLAQMGLL